MAGSSDYSAILRLIGEDRTAAAFASATARARRFGDEATRATGAMGIGADRAASRLSALSNRVGALSAALGALGAGRYLASAITDTARLDEQILRLGQTTGATKQEMALIEPAMRKVARDIKIPFGEVQAGMEVLSQIGGRSVPEMLKLLPTLATVSRAGKASMADVASVSDSLQRSLKIPADRVDEAFDVMIAGARMGKFEFNEMAKYFPILTAQAASLGYEGEAGLKVLVAAMSNIYKETGSAEKSFTALQDLMAKAFSDTVANNFEKQGIAIREELTAIRDSGGDVLAYLTKRTAGLVAAGVPLEALFTEQDSQRAIRAMMNLWTQMGLDIRAMGNVSGTAVRNLADLNKQTTATLTDLGNELLDVKDKFGDLMKEMGSGEGLKWLVEQVRQVGQGIENVEKAIKGWKLFFDDPGQALENLSGGPIRPRAPNVVPHPTTPPLMAPGGIGGDQDRLGGGSGDDTLGGGSGSDDLGGSRWFDDNARRAREQRQRLEERLRVKQEHRAMELEIDARRMALGLTPKFTQLQGDMRLPAMRNLGVPPDLIQTPYSGPDARLPRPRPGYEDPTLARLPRPRPTEDARIPRPRPEVDIVNKLQMTTEERRLWERVIRNVEAAKSARIQAARLLGGVGSAGGGGGGGGGAGTGAYGVSSGPSAGSPAGGARAAAGMQEGGGGTYAGGPNANADSWMNFLMKPQSEGGLGYTADQARGVVAGMMGESGTGLNPGAWNPDDSGMPAAGTAQWRGDRLARLKAHAASMGLPWDSIEAQQSYFRKEMMGSESMADARIRAAGGDEQALGAFVSGFERPKYPGAEVNKRAGYLGGLRAGSSTAIAGGTGGRVLERQGQVARTRKGKLDPRLREALRYASERSGLTADVTSGGQRMPGAEGHTGSHRHDRGRAGDFNLRDENGNIVGPNDPRALEFYRYAAQGGVTGGGAGYMSDPNKIHLDIESDKLGSPVYAGSKQFRESLKRGMSERDQYAAYQQRQSAVADIGTEDADRKLAALRAKAARPVEMQVEAKGGVKKNFRRASARRDFTRETRESRWNSHSDIGAA